MSFRENFHFQKLTKKLTKTKLLCSKCVIKLFSQAMANSERTYIMVKPDGVQRGLVGEIIHRFERRGLKLVALKMRMATEALLRQHYLHRYCGETILS